MEKSLTTDPQITKQGLRHLTKSKLKPFRSTKFTTAVHSLQFSEYGLQFVVHDSTFWSEKRDKGLLIGHS